MQKYLSVPSNLICYLPTGGGKTLICLLALLYEVLHNKLNVIIALPYIALVKEKLKAFAPYALKFNFLIEEYAGGKGCLPPVKRRKTNAVYICTLEKASMLYQSLIELDRAREIGLVVFDEFHFIGEEGSRGILIEELIIFANYFKNCTKILGLSATLDNLNALQNFMNAELFTNTYRPVIYSK